MNVSMRFVWAGALVWVALDVLAFFVGWDTGERTFYEAWRVLAFAAALQVSAVLREGGHG